MQARVVPIINCGLFDPPTVAVCANGSFAFPDIDIGCEIAEREINVYTTAADREKGLFNVKCGEIGCRFYGGKRGERVG